MGHFDAEPAAEGGPEDRASENLRLEVVGDLVGLVEVSGGVGMASGGLGPESGNLVFGWSTGIVANVEAKGHFPPSPEISLGPAGNMLSECCCNSWLEPCECSCG